MRFLLALVGLAAVVVIALVSLGLLSFNTSPGALPSVSVNGGKAPAVHANMATVELGTQQKAVEVPTVSTTTKTITVPTLSVTKPSNETSTANRAISAGAR